MSSGNQSLATQRHCPSFGAAEDGPSDLERGACRRLAGDDDLPWHLDVALEIAEDSLDLVDHRRRHARATILEPIPRVGVCRELRGGDEEVALDPEDEFRKLAECR